MKLKKPKFWDFKKPNYLSDLLLPLSKLIEIHSGIKRMKKKRIEGIKTICVGNLYLGGTGKTSIAIELKKIFDEQGIKSCFIKKEYLKQIDEQKLLETFGTTFINRSRFEALKEAHSKNFKVAIFDDGLQDSAISYDLSFVCFNKKNFIGNGRTIPAGPLREPLINLSKYKNVFFNGNDEDNKNLEEILSMNNYNLNFYGSKYELLNLDQLNLDHQYVVFSGIGNHYTFIDMLKKNNFKIIYDLEFPDHYNFSHKDIDKINQIAKENNAQILTTQKDYLRLEMKLKSGINYTKINLKIDQIEKLKKKLIDLNVHENN